MPTLRHTTRRPWVVQLRGEQYGLSMAPAAPVFQEARRSGQLASFAHVPELRVSTNEAPQKILRHMQRGGMFVEVNGRFLMICISTLSNLTVIEICRVRRGLRPPSAHTSALFALMDAQPTSCAKARRGGEGRRLLCRARLVRCPPHQPGAREDLHVAGRWRARHVALCALSAKRVRAVAIIPKRQPVEAVGCEKKAALRLFVAHGKNLAVRRVLLAVCPNGDW